MRKNKRNDNNVTICVICLLLIMLEKMFYKGNGYIKTMRFTVKGKLGSNRFYQTKQREKIPKYFLKSVLLIM